MSQISRDGILRDISQAATSPAQMFFSPDSNIDRLAKMMHILGSVAENYNDLVKHSDEGAHVKQEIKRRLHFELMALAVATIEAIEFNNFSFEERTK